MLVFDLLKLQDSRITPESCKVHLAGHNGIEDPLDVYKAGRFDEWQSWQSRRNFPRAYVVALIQLQETHSWMFVGAYESRGCVPNDEDAFSYDLVPIEATAEFGGRLVGKFVRPGRQPYLNGESVASKFTIHEITPEKAQIADFPGFKMVNLTFAQLGVIARQNLTSWRAALGNAAGVYLISDALDGKLYVGSATGEGGIWARWCQYLDGHGENKRLRELIKSGGLERAQHFHFSILEIADTHTGWEEILARESHWKMVLLSRAHGHNAN